MYMILVWMHVHSDSFVCILGWERLAPFPKIVRRTLSQVIQAFVDMIL